jgi:hypothetical protein
MDRRHPRHSRFDRHAPPLHHRHHRHHQLLDDALLGQWPPSPSPEDQDDEVEYPDMGDAGEGEEEEEVWEAYDPDTLDSSDTHPLGSSGVTAEERSLLESFGGFPVDLLVAHEGADAAQYEPPEELVCGICQDLQRDAMLLSACGHSFCESCLTRALDAKLQCPMCREEPHEHDPLPDKRIRRLINQLTIRCTHGHGDRADAAAAASPSPAQAVCSWRGRVDKLQCHLAAAHGSS